ncbi:E3 ubiquitin-protein ligase Praja-2 isoform X1 [Podarcis raffonei]|uniref:E3 ubiquitin-protein ligase Praja-2 isoform X1 n=2 Tax=Podarcis raffonei TaxID=65483 RepID=UPI0023293BE5|nr:E3 ubiquitin-protein ligase Praja-2 isoform X1 [Podarcis raffonei]XP_053263602.1 E3 ubiquitin-protein ligase Praja-2 isoform X1 [Podarcis raffonei]XP_053263603.1 E3 ubiquitin-protein ligase Praja-2 isoform X1 [Podarcis raffonei]
MDHIEVFSNKTLLNCKMGQEAGKPTWPKPAGGYQTITGRRYGRRHAYVNFRPSLTNQERNSSQHDGECEGLELDDVQKENYLCSSPLAQVCSPLADVPLLAKVASENPVGQAELNQAVNTDASPFSPACYSWGDGQTGSNNMNSDTCGEHNNLNGQNGIAFVNIDSYEPDSSDGEEENDQNDLSLAKEEAGIFQETLDSMLSELEKGVDSFSDLQSHLSNFNHNASSKSFEDIRPVPFKRHSSLELDTAHQNKTLVKTSSEDERLVKNNLSLTSDMEQQKNTADPTIRTQIGICNELSTVKTDQENSSELVVRPKVRKQNPVSQLDRKQSFSNEEEEKTSSRRWSENVDVQHCNTECVLKHSKEKSNSSMFFDPRDYGGAQKKIKSELRKQNITLQEKSKVDDSAFWDEFEDSGRNLSSSNKDEDSSECSDGEWSASLPSYFAVTVKDQSSSDESWETLPGKEEQEPELQSDSSGVEEEQNEFGFQAGEQTTLEDGEIPWLQYHEEIESSSDEENDQVSHFVHPGFFMLDGNNNLEDDSSMSEDLDVEWRLLDEFGDGLGVAQAISYVDPQFLTYMALEERLAQAMETALAHLESLAIDVEQAHPPASKESIDCLPQIIITEDHNAVGQEQCCAICCSEYIKEEIVTELPCHHFFHKPCITLWLQKSGTCPVCRHVLAPVLPETSIPTVTFLPDHDSTPSVHSTSGTQ